MPANWSLEALKAQAVAARSYAWAHSISQGGSKWASDGFDLVPDVRDQAYKGLAVEKPKSTLAVMQTQGIILKDSGRVKAGFYRAWVGDAMENLNIRRKLVSGAVLEKLTGVPQIVGMSVKVWNENQNDVAKEGADWKFTYRGPGNGSRGLSQHGADMLAQRGWLFEQILRQYYQDQDGRLRLDYIDSSSMAARPRKHKPAAAVIEEDSDTN
jgi:peptidoglycan hydrolase-like amidase